MQREWPHYRRVARRAESAPANSQGVSVRDHARTAWFFYGCIASRQRVSGSKASWWRRNVRRYANIQRHANPGARIRVMGGQGHTAILRDFMAIDSSVDEALIAPFLALGQR